MNGPLIIDRPALQPWGERALWNAVTALVWFAWLYLWLPWFTLAAWLLFGFTGYQQSVIFRLQGGNLWLFGAYFAVVLILGGALLGWAFNEWRRFAGKERRRRAPDLDAADLSTLFGFDPARIAHWQGARRLVVHHDASGRIIAADTGPAIPACGACPPARPSIEP